MKKSLITIISCMVLTGFVLSGCERRFYEGDRDGRERYHHEHHRHYRDEHRDRDDNDRD